MPDQIPVQEPFPIHSVAGRYLLYDVNVVSHVRATHHMCGCLSGTLPQIPQQNVFLGLPLELMEEEAALLLEKGAAYISDDVTAHTTGLKNMLAADKAAFIAARRRECEGEALAHQKSAEDRRAAYVRELGIVETSPPTEDLKPKVVTEEVSLFDKSNKEAPMLANEKTPAQASLRFYPVASVSHPTFHTTVPVSVSSSLIPSPNPNSYPLYRYLQQRGYYLSPGLRFGCQFMAYPGDPLRFHSHFVAQGLGWDEEIDVLDVVGGGRLGTGVKKAWMIGGEDKQKNMRVFCVEWGGF
ncbi:hypothetical protein EDC01DRAFT_652624 [Geopyxis carbonaria]|nr:hypothetical protein EDC01DRAFT_652624 [Geopyxis carbonaria]